MRGFGLAFVDLMVLLTEGRGGSYTTGADGQPVYRPSGREPVLHVGSRRGVPYHSKIGYELDGERPPLPRFFGPEQVDALLARPDGFDFRRDVWPLIDKELGFAHYHRLFTAHPESHPDELAGLRGEVRRRGPRQRRPPGPGRRRGPGPRRPARPGGAGPSAGRACATPTPRRSRTGCAAISRPTWPAVTTPHTAPTWRSSSRCCPSTASWSGSATAAPGGTGSSAISPPARPDRGCGSCSRSPGPGWSASSAPDTTVTAERGAGCSARRAPACRASRSRPGRWSRRGCRQPTVERTRDALLRALYADGAADDPRPGSWRWTPPTAGSWTGPARPHPRRFALGPHTDARSGGAFTRPRTNAPAFRQNDATARALLTFLRDRAAPPAPRPAASLARPAPTPEDSHAPDQ